MSKFARIAILEQTFLVGELLSEVITNDSLAISFLFSISPQNLQFSAFSTLKPRLISRLSLVGLLGQASCLFFEKSTVIHPQLTHEELRGIFQLSKLNQLACDSLGSRCQATIEWISP